jgi:hypothetical protein
MNPELVYALEQTIKQAEKTIALQEGAIARAVYELARIAPQA